MAVRLRLRRVGRKKLPVYKVVAADSRSPRDGRYIEAVGQYEPLRQSNNVEFKEDRVMYWLQNGAQPTDTVRNLLSSQGLWLKWSMLKKGADESAINEQMEKFAAQRVEKEKRAQEKASQKKEEKPAEKPEQVEIIASDETASEQTPEEKPETGEKEPPAAEENQAAPEQEKTERQEDAAPEQSPEEKPEAQDQNSDKKDKSF